MDGVPLRMPQVASQQVQQDVHVIVPDYLSRLQDTEYEFSLENWVLTGLQNGFTSQHRPPLSSSSGLQPSCPPYWMMFSSPQQSRLASRHRSDFWEPNPRQRSHSFNLGVLRAKLPVSDSEDEASEEAGSGGDIPAATCRRGPRKAQRAFVPDLLNPPACLSSLPHQCRKNLRQCSLSLLDTFEQHGPNSPSSNTTAIRRASNTRASNTRAPNTRANTVDMLPNMNNHNTKHMVRVKC
ncbi:hypothetical protein EYF80_024413 [Liparis tanakae]|uniref:Uncharacterized protein n=1 Tax=Liparis tanakae TaxID=230148 RepID=A0A4Z2HHR7_9TELE|nr:hypothetical protein EYF80_024413 [Liparis tanakae]